MFLLPIFAILSLLIRIGNGIIFPPLIQLCSHYKFHNIYGIDYSQSMGYYDSWNQVANFLQNQVTNNNYVSSFKYLNIHNPIPDRAHELSPNSIFKTFGVAPTSGISTYQTVISKMKIFINAYTPTIYNTVEHINIYIISDGFDNYSINDVASLIELKTFHIFHTDTDTESDFCKRTVKCYQTRKFSGKTKFEQLCQAAGVAVVYLKSSPILDINIAPPLQNA